MYDWPLPYVPYPHRITSYLGHGFAIAPASAAFLIAIALIAKVPRPLLNILISVATVADPSAAWGARPLPRLHIVSTRRQPRRVARSLQQNCFGGRRGPNADDVFEALFAAIELPLEEDFAPLGKQGRL